MFCPQCGADDQKVDAYCKRCGVWLPDMPGVVRRALWGQGIKPEQKIKMMLIWQALSFFLALSSAIALFASGSSTGNSKKLVYTVAWMCLSIAGLQLDSFFVALRMRQNFKHSRSDAERAIKPLAESDASLENSSDTAELADARGAREVTTRRLETKQIGIPERDK
ncbi:MAG: hypothetical protein ICV68_13890 [Pyrinomonadaceae bacterium]|nr:hypothetical protein [Pyrinomonadaceae bacterium]